MTLNPKNDIVFSADEVVDARPVTKFDFKASTTVTDSDSKSFGYLPTTYVENGRLMQYNEETKRHEIIVENDDV